MLVVSVSKVYQFLQSSDFYYFMALLLLLWHYFIALFLLFYGIIIWPIRRIIFYKTSLKTTLPPITLIVMGVISLVYGVSISSPVTSDSDP